MTYKHLAIATSLLSSLLVAGCGDSDSGIPFGGNTGTNPANPITAPTAGNIAFSVLGSSSTTATAANGILSVGNPNTATVVNVQSPTTRGGTITANADGSFTYNAPALGNTTDTFSYTIQNAGGIATGTATVTLLGRGFFVNNQAAPGGTGTQAQPFQTIAQVQAAATGINGAEIVVFRGDGTSNLLNTPISLAGNQTLRGFDATNPPTLTGPINFSSSNRVQDVRFVNSPGTAINATGASGGSIQSVSFSNITNRAVDLGNASGSFSVGNCTVQNAFSAFEATSTSGSLTWSLQNSAVTNGSICSACGQIGGTASQNMTVNNCTFTGGNANTLRINGNSNGTNFNVLVSNNTFSGGGTAQRGIGISNQGSTILAGRVLSNRISDSGDGINISSIANSVTKLRFNDNVLQGNGSQFGAISSGNSSLSMAMQRNQSGQFVLGQVNPGIFNFEELSLFNAASANIGSLIFSGGTITDSPAGTTGIP